MLNSNRIAELIQTFGNKEKLDDVSAFALLFNNPNNNYVNCEIIIRAKNQNIVKEATQRLLEHGPDAYEMSIAFAYLKNNGNGIEKLKEEIGGRVLNLNPDYWTLMFLQKDCDVPKLIPVFKKRIKQVKRDKRQHATMLIAPKVQ